MVICLGKLFKPILPLFAECLMIPHGTTKDLKLLFLGRVRRKAGLLVHHFCAQLWGDPEPGPFWVKMCLHVSKSICIRGSEAEWAKLWAVGGWRCAVVQPPLQQHSPALHRDPALHRGCRRAVLCVLLPPGMFWQTCQSCSAHLPACALQVRETHLLPYTFEITYLTTAFPSGTKIMKLFLYLFYFIRMKSCNEMSWMHQDNCLKCMGIRFDKH